MQPERGDAIEAWLKAKRQESNDESNTSSLASERYWAYDALLDEYRAHADFGVPLGEELPEEAFK